jgi:large subunit ribosomal protein L23
MKPENVIKGPVLSEKSVGLTEKAVYGLKVDVKATKAQIRTVLKDVFDVDAVRIRTLIVRGDVTKRSRGKGSSASVTIKVPNLKKAYVQLKEGQSLPVPTVLPSANPSQA